MDHDWGDWPEDDDPTGDAADTSDLGTGSEEQLGYDDHGTYPDASSDPGDDPGDHGDGGAGAGHTDSGYYEDEPMSLLGDGDDMPSGDGDDPGDDGSDPPDDDDPNAWQVPDDDGGDPVSTESVVGANPDVDPDADWAPADFPEQLELTPPAPVDGYPWSDPAAVAEPGTGDDPTTLPQDAPPTADLLDYAATDGGGDPWAALLGSDDPAASSLGRWWSPA
jgi:hypothetical protein